MVTILTEHVFTYNPFTNSRLNTLVHVYHYDDISRMLIRFIRPLTCGITSLEYILSILMKPLCRWLYTKVDAIIGPVDTSNKTYAGFNLMWSWEG